MKFHIYGNENMFYGFIEKDDVMWYWWRHTRKIGDFTRTAKSGVNTIVFLSKFQNILGLVRVFAVEFLGKITTH